MYGWEDGFIPVVARFFADFLFCLTAERSLRLRVRDGARFARGPFGPLTLRAGIGLT